MKYSVLALLIFFFKIPFAKCSRTRFIQLPVPINIRQMFSSVALFNVALDREKSER